MPLLTVKELQDSSYIFRGKIGKILAQGLMDISCVSRINALYDRYPSLKGPDFTSAILEDLGVQYEIKNRNAIDVLREGAFITISNHPYGGLDGLILVDFIGHFRPDYKVMVNKVLGRIKNLDDNFIDVIPTGRKQGKPENESIHGIRSVVEHVCSGHPVGIFPAGAISDVNLSKFRIEDRQWQESVIRLIKKLRVPILPIRFLGGNSSLFYSLGLIDWRIRLMKLPSELFNKKGKTVKLILGNVISPELQDEYSDIEAFRTFLRENVYNLK